VLRDRSSPKDLWADSRMQTAAAIPSALFLGTVPVVLAGLLHASGRPHLLVVAGSRIGAWWLILK